MGIGIIFYILSSLLYVFDLFLLVRAICSWVPSFRESMIYRLTYTVTEPILRPVRDLLYNWEWARRCPIDLSFIVVVLLVNALSSALSYLAYLF
ncbi:MAG: YggT family protein [Clostridia bacterium]|nr:YggT family protein [Clostridia bacterium]